MAADSSWRRRSGGGNFTLILLLLFLHKAACTVIANCSASGCSNGGSCIQIQASNLFNCACTQGWSGPLCTIADTASSIMNFCSSSPCLNEAVCQDMLGMYVCICGVQWQGKNCEQLRDGSPISFGCGSQEVKCANGACVNHRLWCDGGRDCLDGSDEKDCPAGSDPFTGCKQWEFRCANELFCIPVENRCNHVKDCANNADEYGCMHTDYEMPDLPPASGQCGRLEFLCDDGRCIIGRARCDGSPDCRDGSDERNCASIELHPVCSVWEFDCGDGSCVHRGRRCDHYPDCQNEADEANCDASYPKLPSEEQPPPATPIHPPGNSLNLVDILIVSCAMLMAFVAITIFVYLRRVRRMHQRYFAAVGAGAPNGATSEVRHRHYRRQQGTPYRLSHHSTFCHHLPPHRCPASTNLLVSYNLHTGAQVMGRNAAAADKDETDRADEVPPAYSDVVGTSGTWLRDGSETPPPAYEDLATAYRH